MFLSNDADSHNNTLAETINGLSKTEAVNKDGPWKEFEQVELATLDWVDWFSNKRLLNSVGNIPSAEFEENCYRQFKKKEVA